MLHHRGAMQSMRPRLSPGPREDFCSLPCANVALTSFTALTGGTHLEHNAFGPSVFHTPTGTRCPVVGNKTLCRQRTCSGTTCTCSGPEAYSSTCTCNSKPEFCSSTQWQAADLLQPGSGTSKDVKVRVLLHVLIGYRTVLA